MINIYKYIFYRTYKWQLKLWGDKDVPEFKAMLVVLFVVMQNIFTIGLLLQVFGLMGGVLDLSKTILIILSISIILILYLSLVHRNKYKAIVKAFENESAKQRIRNTMFMWLFITGSLAVDFIIIGKFLR